MIRTIHAGQRLFQRANRNDQFTKQLPSRFSLVLALLMLPSGIVASVTNIVSDGNWSVTNPAPPAGWNTSVGFDDSDGAGWEYAFKAPSGNNIWMRSNQSASSPNQVWFRHVFRLPAQPLSASGTFNFDDDGQVYLNGTLVV